MSTSNPNPNPKNIPGSGRPAASAKPASPAPAEAPPAHVPPLYRRIDWWSFALTSILVMFGYWWTLAPDLTLEDCGELAVASMYAGVPHPPGYPVWTLYSWLFTLLPISNIAYRVALSSAFAGALSCGLVALMVSRGSSMIIEGIADLKNIERKWENGLCLVAGLVAGLLIGFNGFMWSQAVIVEVYTLSVLSMTLVLACLLRWIYAPHQRRYLYWAFFWFGICFNNHQSLLVLAMGLEVGILAVAPKMGRALFFWNVIIYLGGLIGKSLGMVGTLEGNSPLMLVYHFVGLSSLAVWIWLVVKTKWTAIEAGRDFLIVAVLGYVAALLLSITNFVTVFKYTDTLEYKVPVFFVFNVVGLGAIGGLIYSIRKARTRGSDWAAALGCGAAWIVGASFYVYMALASMSNPPLNWGYPRTVQGFFHAFTRGQYERIHPTIGQAMDQTDGKLATDIGRYIYQVGNYIGGTLEEFNLVYVLLGFVPLLFLGKMQKRERAWMIGLLAIYLTLSLFLLNLLNPAPDRQSRDLNRVFFTASHFMVAMGVGYGLTIIGAYLVTQYERWRRYCLIGALASAGLALLIVAVTFQGDNPMINFHNPVFDLNPSYAPIERFTDLFGLALALGGVGLLLAGRTRLLFLPTLALFALLPLHSILSHWSENEQRGHYFGYWFGHDMFTPPFKDGASGKPLYPDMARDTVLYGGTDPGRFNPTYMIFCESFIPPAKRNPMDANFDRRDVYLITQNALADGTYLNYIRAHYNRSAQLDPPFFSELVRGPKELELGTKTNILACAMRPLDRFFLGLGDRIEKSRRAGTSFFQAGDFTDLAGLAARLKAAADPVSKFVFEHLSKDTQQMLSGGASDALRRPLARDLNALLELELNHQDAWIPTLDERAQLQQQIELLAAAVQRPPASPTDTAAVQRHAEAQTRLQAARDRLPKLEQELAAMMLYDAARFQGVKLSDRTKRFAAQEPRSHTRIRLNRQLLEETYPKEIAKSIGGVYPDMEILSATNDDSQRSFQEYLADAQRRLEHDRRAPNEPRQLRPGEDVRIIDNKVQVSGQVAVMAINALLTKVIFDKNPDHEFYVEESFPLDWMYPHLTPFGIIMKINRNPVAEMSQEVCDTDHKFWRQFSTRLIGDWIDYDTPISNICAFAEQVYYRKKHPADFKGDPRFLRDNDAQKAFSKLRSSIAGLYAWRMGDAAKRGNVAEYQRMTKEAEFAFKQAYAYCPYSPEAIFRYINLLIAMGRVDEAILMATTSQKLDPFNSQIDGLIYELKRIKAGMPQASSPSAPPAGSDTASLEKAFDADPKSVGIAYQLANAYAQQGQADRVVLLLDRLVENAKTDPAALTMAGTFYGQLGQFPRAESALQQLVKVTPQNPEGNFDLAAVQALLSKSNEALGSLRAALDQNAKRLAGDRRAQNLYTNAVTDQRFASLRGWSEFNRVLATYATNP